MTIDKPIGGQIHIVGSPFTSAEILKFARDNAMSREVAAAILSHVDSLEAGVEVARKMRGDAAELRKPRKPQVD